MDADDDSDLGNTETLGDEEDGEGDPDERVDEVLDVSRLRCGKERPVLVGRAFDDLGEREVGLTRSAVSFDAVTIVVETCRLCLRVGRVSSIRTIAMSKATTITAAK